LKKSRRATIGGSTVCHLAASLRQSVHNRIRNDVLSNRYARLVPGKSHGGFARVGIVICQLPNSPTYRAARSESQNRLRWRRGLPAFEVSNCGTTGSSIPPGPCDAAFDYAARRHKLRRDSVEGDLQPAAPARVGLAGICPNIDVYEALSPRPLDKRTAQCCHAI